RQVVAEFAVADSAAEQLGPEQFRRPGHLPAAHRGQVGDALGRLALVGPAERAGAEQFGVVRVGDDGQHALPGEVEPHRNPTTGRAATYSATLNTASACSRSSDAGQA